VKRLTASHSGTLRLAAMITMGLILLASASAQTQINPSQIKTAAPGTRELIWSETIVTQLQDGSYLFPIPVNPPGTSNVVTMGPTVFRNNVRQTSGTDYTVILSGGGPSRFVPMTPWTPNDIVLVEYWSVINGGPTLASPGVSAAGSQVRKPWIRRLIGR